MNDEELLQEQVVMTTSQSQIGQSVWVYRGSMWGKFLKVEAVGLLRLRLTSSTY